MDKLINGFALHQLLDLPAQDVNKVIDTFHMYRPIHLAILYSNNPHVFVNLIHRGANLDSKVRTGDTAYSLAVRHGNHAFWEGVDRAKTLKFDGIQSENDKLAREVTQLKRDNDGLRKKIQDMENKNSNLEESFTNLSQSLRKRRRLE
jgi:ankyrin repeat protein